MGYKIRLRLNTNNVLSYNIITHYLLLTLFITVLYYIINKLIQIIFTYYYIWLRLWKTCTILFTPTTVFCKFFGLNAGFVQCHLPTV